MMKLLGKNEEKKYIAIHNKCGQEAFCYYGNPNLGSKWYGAKIYKRGMRPYTLPKEGKASVSCYHCTMMGKHDNIIRSTDDFKVVAEQFTQRAQHRFVSYITKYREALAVAASAHLSLLEYPLLMGMKIEQWEAMQHQYDSQLKSITEFINEFLSNEIDCGIYQGDKKSNIVLASSSGKLI